MAACKTGSRIKAMRKRLMKQDRVIFFGIKMLTCGGGGCVPPSYVSFIMSKNTYRLVYVPQQCLFF